MKLKFKSKFLRFLTSFATSKLSGGVKNGPNWCGKVLWDTRDTPLSSALWITIVGYVENVLGVIECEILWKMEIRRIFNAFCRGVTLRMMISAIFMKIFNFFEKVTVFYTFSAGKSFELLMSLEGNESQIMNLSLNHV